MIAVNLPLLVLLVVIVPQEGSIVVEPHGAIPRPIARRPPERITQPRDLDRPHVRYDDADYSDDEPRDRDEDVDESTVASFPWFGQPDASLASSTTTPPDGRESRDEERGDEDGGPEEPAVGRVPRAGVGGSEVEGDTAGAGRVRDLAHARSLVPERLVPGTGRVGFERLGSIDENADSSRVALVIEFTGVYRVSIR
jgi:hypothetical protein